MEADNLFKKRSNFRLVLYEESSVLEVDFALF